MIEKCFFVTIAMFLILPRGVLTSVLTVNNELVDTSQIIHMLYNVSITSCYLKCDENPSCDMIALSTEPKLGRQQECYHIMRILQKNGTAADSKYVFAITQVSCNVVYSLMISNGMLLMTWIIFIYLFILFAVFMICDGSFVKHWK